MAVKPIKRSRIKRYIKHSFNFELSPNNQVTYIYKTDNKGRIIEITCVSLEIKMNTKWLTIIYYDDTHGQLHRHTFLSSKQAIDVVDYVDPLSVSTREKALQWAVEDIKHNYLEYKKKFVQEILELKIGIDIDDY